MALAGGVTAYLFGPDDRATTGPHSIRVDGVGLTTAPRAIAYAGPRLELTIRSRPAARALFAGVAHAVDARDFLRRAPHTRVDEIKLPWEIDTTAVRGAGQLAAAPDRVDIWATEASGRGTVTLEWLLTNAPQDLVIVDARGRRISSLAVTVSVVLPGGFVGGLALAVFGLGMSVVGAVVASTGRRGR
jgi:hypothetical protein